MLDNEREGKGKLKINMPEFLLDFLEDLYYLFYKMRSSTPFGNLKFKIITSWVQLEEIESLNK